MKNFTGTPKQISYANDLYNQFLEGAKQRVAKFEGRELQEFQIPRFEEAKAKLKIIENTTITDASEMISVMNNIAGGGYDLDGLTEILQSK